MMEVMKAMGLEALLTTDDVAALIRRPKRFVLGLIKSGSLRAVKLGGNSWRIEPAEYRRWLAQGAPSGFRHAKPSGGLRPGMAGYKGDERGRKVKCS